MSRTLVRYVFPQFVFRLTIIVTLVAAGIFVFARSYRIDLELSKIESETDVFFSVLESDLIAAETVPLLINQISRRSGLILGLADQEGRIIVGSEPGAQRVLNTLTPLPSTETTVGPEATGGDHFGSIRPISIPQIPEASLGYAFSTAPDLVRGLRDLAASLLVLVAGLTLIIITLSYRVVRNIQDPIIRLQNAASYFAEGDLSYRIEVIEPLELRRLAVTMNGMAEQLTTRIEAIRGQRTQLESILANMIEGVVLLDDRFQVKTMNAAAMRLFDVSAPPQEEREPRTLLELIRNSEIYDVVVQTYATGLNQERTITIYSNPPRYMQIHSGVIDRGETGAVLLVFNDVTRMQELENIRKDFVANVSHELKTPITSILGFVETLTDGAVSDPQEADRFLAIIASQAHRLNAIIEDLLQLSRLEQQRDGISAESCRIEEIIAGVKETLEQKAREKGITLVDEYFGNPRIVANPTLLEQAITNLLDNAVKYCPAGARVAIRFSRTADSFRLEVKDNGPGIPEMAHARIFERFFRVDRARSRSEGGTGLGLAIVKHIAQAHGGSVALDSTIGVGSVFTVEIPQAESARNSA